MAIILKPQSRLFTINFLYMIRIWETKGFCVTNIENGRICINELIFYIKIFINSL